MADRKTSSRRTLIRAALTGAATLVLASVSSSRAQQKMTKARAEYQDSPKGILMCATCSLFEPPRSCKIVEGDVLAEGWCNAFDLAD